MAEEKVLTPEAPKAEEVKEAAKEAAPERKDRPQRGEHGPRRENRRDPRHGRGEEVKEFEEVVVDINRIAKTVKGGRKMRFSALVVIGNKKGKFGYGTGKAAEVPDAIKKALEAAKRNTFEIHIEKKGATIAHETIGNFGACHVFLKPAPEGTGIIAGGPVRAILELAGVRNVTSKVYGSRAPINVIRATTNGLTGLKSFHQVQVRRGKSEK